MQSFCTSWGARAKAPAGTQIAVAGTSIYLSIYLSIYKIHRPGTLSSSNHDDHVSISQKWVEGKGLKV